MTQHVAWLHHSPTHSHIYSPVHILTHPFTRPSIVPSMRALGATSNHPELSLVCGLAFATPASPVLCDPSVPDNVLAGAFQFILRLLSAAIVVCVCLFLSIMRRVCCSTCELYLFWHWNNNNKQQTTPLGCQSPFPIPPYTSLVFQYVGLN